LSHWGGGEEKKELTTSPLWRFCGGKREEPRKKCPEKSRKHAFKKKKTGTKRKKTEKEGHDKQKPGEWEGTAVEHGEWEKKEKEKVENFCQETIGGGGEKGGSKNSSRMA